MEYYLYSRMKGWSKNSWFWFAIALLSVWFWNGLDYFVSGCTLPHSTADDYSYIQPGLDFWLTGTYGGSSQNPSAYVQRPPLLGLMLGGLKLLFGSAYGTVWLIISSLLFACSSKFIFAFTKHVRLNWIFVGIYCCFPLFSSFTSYQFSESTLPFFVIYPIWAIANQKRMHLTLSCFLLYMLRPQALLLIIPWLVYDMITKTAEWKKKKVLLLLFVVTVFVGFWEARKIHFLGNYQVHGIYSWENKSLFRPPHEALTNVFRTFSYKPEDFHRYAVGAREGTLTAKDYQELTEKLGKSGISDSRGVVACVKQYNAIHTSLLASWTKGVKVSKTQEEEQFIKAANALTDQIKSENFTLAYVWTPMKSLFHLFKMSHLHQHVLQREWSSSFLVKLMKGLSIALIWGMWLMSLGFLREKSTWFVFLGPTLYLLYLGWIQVLNEDRYLYPWILYSFVALIALSIKRKSNSEAD